MLFQCLFNNYCGYRSIIDSITVSFKLAFTDGWEITVAAMLKSLLPGKLGFSSAIMDLIAKFRLDQLGLIVSDVTLNVNPWAFKVSGTLKMWGLFVNFNVLVGNLGGNGWKAALAFTLPGSAIQHVINLMGPAGMSYRWSFFPCCGRCCCLCCCGK
jgi:hypothetical protein